MKPYAQIPNLITLLNLLCGVLGIAATAGGYPATGAWFILAGAFADFLDGMAARLLRVQGPIGRELDSLADVVTFGVAPAFIALHYSGGYPLQVLSFREMALAYSPLLIATGAAYRLAKFNIDTRQTDSFLGLPTPANALFWLSLPLILQGEGGPLRPFYESMVQPVFIALLSLLAAALMVSELPLMSLKFKSLAVKDNALRYLLLAVCAIAVSVLKFEAVPIVLLLYILLSLIQKRTRHGIQSRN